MTKDMNRDCNCNKCGILPPRVGTVLKLAVEAELGNGLHMKDVDFTCTFFSSGYTGRPQTFRKGDMTADGDDCYVASVDTSVVGPGCYYCRLTAWIPDADVNGGLRKEVVEFPVEDGTVMR